MSFGPVGLLYMSVAAWYHGVQRCAVAVKPAIRVIISALTLVSTFIADATTALRCSQTDEAAKVT